MERKNGRLSSEMLKRKRTKGKRKSGTDPGGEIQKGSTCGTAVGAKQGRTKGNEQRIEYAEPEEADGKPAVDEGEERRGRKEPSLDEEPTVRRIGQRAERKKQRLSSRKGSRRDRKGNGGGTENTGSESGR